MRKKLIGIVGSLFYQNSQSLSTVFGYHAAYLEYFRQFGDVITIDCATDRVLPIDLLVLPGGADVDTNRYNQAPGIHTGRPNTFLEYFDMNVLPKYIEACANGELGIWGTCRGSQSLAVHYGIPLQQNIVQQVSNPRSKLVDKVILFEENQPEEITEHIPDGWYGHKRAYVNSLLEINSLHHQGYMFEDFDGTELLPLAYNVEPQPGGDFNIEFFRHRSLKIAAGQHHCEECFDPYSKILIDWLLTNEEEPVFNYENAAANDKN